MNDQIIVAMVYRENFIFGLLIFIIHFKSAPQDTEIDLEATRHNFRNQIFYISQIKVSET